MTDFTYQLSQICMGFSEPIVTNVSSFAFLAKPVVVDLKSDIVVRIPLSEFICSFKSLFSSWSLLISA